MNIQSQEYFADDAFGANRHLAAAITAHGSDSTYSERLAIDAIASGRAAYWTRNSRHNASAGILLDSLNRGASMEDALAEVYPPHRRSWLERGLDTLVPLNRAAANALAKAYVQFTPTWVEDAELLARRFASVEREAV